MEAVCGELERFVDDLKLCRLHATHSAALFETVMQCYEARFPTREEFPDAAWEAVRRICAVMPPYAPLINAMNRFCLRLERRDTKGALRDGKDPQAEMQMTACRLLRGKSTVCTFTFSQTVSECFRALKEHGLEFSVLVTESAPNRDGLDTVKKLVECQIPCRASLDADMRPLAATADIALFGCEAVLSDGSVIGKVGQSAMAHWCARHAVPVYIYAGINKLLPPQISGAPSLIRDMPIAGNIPHARLFDVTPAGCITGVITEKGVLPPSYSSSFLNHDISEKLLRWIS